ncbi:hypothetical protein CTZ28_23745 [Streptomyces shenzhenensis]|uniref:Uncharacterized protein n=1 Tax=Streptomyces shenzhenensis TaxID=943815 RepID=A0A3M0I9E4_9ACTN|nr:hypothetical protein CTZ28_23745 [Streptomyces shenzhenensis]
MHLAATSPTAAPNRVSHFPGPGLGQRCVGDGGVGRSGKAVGHSRRVSADGLKELIDIPDLGFRLQALLEAGRRGVDMGGVRSDRPSVR